MTVDTKHPGLDALVAEPEVRERLQCSRDTLWKLTRSGKLRSVKLGRSRRWRESDLAQFIADLSDGES